MKQSTWLFAALTLTAASPRPANAAASPQTLPSAEVEFFEKSVRPLLESHCVECHSAAKGKTKGGLALDTAAGLQKGGTTGAALEAGLPDRSLLITAVRYKDSDLQMPPDGKKLSDAQIAVLEEWVRRGAIDPREGKAPGPDPEAARTHWAYQPIQNPQPPQIQNTAWPKSPIDHFILAKLESRGLPPSPEADRKTLLRRISYDLTGLPPTQAELDAFLLDSSPEAYEKVVDRLLASPRFGERWGRYWLDVARYSDTKGLPAPINADRRFHFAFSYRDYVIDSFNQDKPFNQFVREQLAADALTEQKDDPLLAALGFLTVGRCFQNQIHEIIDDRIDVVTRGLMGISVACARCHDHKFDPISTKDYYALHGVFMSSEEPKEKPVIQKPGDSPAYQAYLQKRAGLIQKIDEAVSEEVRKDLDQIARKTGEYLMASLEKEGLTDPKTLQTFAGQRGLVALPLERWTKQLQSEEHRALLKPWKTLCALPAETFEAQAKAQIAQWSTSEPSELNPLLLKALQTTPPPNLKALSQIYSQLSEHVLKSVAARRKSAPETSAADPLPDPSEEAIRSLLFKEGAPCHMTPKESETIFGRKLSEIRVKFQDKVTELDGQDPAAPARAMALFDKPAPVEPVVFVRGNPGNRGPKVPRKFITFLSAPDAPSFQKGSGRLELAEAIVDPKNPLTARVAVNRIWLHLFGRGLVQTPNDFGVQTPPPTHPELLDYLAHRFVTQGWSFKKTIRSLVLSSTYTQSSAPRADADAVDPANDGLHSQRRRRLDYEAMQDTLVLLAGCLDETRGGRPVELTKAPFPGRRSVYGNIDRQDLPSVLRNFDFANPDITTGQRFETTVPQQALFLLNSDLLASRAKAVASLPEIQAAPAGTERVAALFRRLYQRKASPQELEASQRFLQSFGDDPQKPWEALAQVLLLSNETVFID